MLCKAALSCELLQTTSYELHLPHCNSFVVGACKGTHYRNSILVAFLNRDENERVAAKELRIES